jgi:cob(I)alamin adenosyltransferase
MILRCVAHEMPCAVVQFIKGAWDTGERRLLTENFADLCEFHAMGEGFTWETQDRDRDIAKTKEAWDVGLGYIRNPEYKLVLLDEVNIALKLGYLDVETVIAGLKEKPADSHVILTGRGAPPELIEVADLVTRMELVKHPFREQGVKAQAGIEF